MQGNNRRLHWRALLVSGVAGLALVALFKIALASGVNNAPVPQQEVFRLETRINQLEQRLIQIDTSIRGLQQQSRLGAGAGSGGVSAQDVQLLRTQIQALQIRLAEDECALAKLDERTLSPAMRNSRRQSGVRSDPCRVNVETPVRLPERE
ncbi:MAG TPA: hypothetical protein VFY61_00505 [Pyrinomonadaceae bacterium]|nr:hypothetical protein [Pyrinomonadaceae bacterium]